MLEIIDWLKTTPQGLAALLGGLFLLFGLVAIVYEWKTRRIFPDRDRRGSKAAAKAKAKKKAAASQAEPKKKTQTKTQKDSQESKED